MLGFSSVLFPYFSPIVSNLDPPKWLSRYCYVIAMVERGESGYRRLLNLNLLPCYSLDQGCPCPLLTLSPFGRE
jgi:hypothetical protein